MHERRCRYEGEKIRQLLETQHVHYELISHPLAYTSNKTAHLAHVRVAIWLSR